MPILDDWVDAQPGPSAGLEPDFSQSDEIKTAAYMAVVDPRAQAIWQEEAPELAEGMMRVNLRVRVGTVIGELLDGGFVPRKVRQEAQAEWLEMLSAERDRLKGQLAAIIERLKELDDEQGLIAAEIASLREAQAEYEGKEPIEGVAMVLEGAHRHRGVQQ